MDYGKKIIDKIEHSDLAQSTKDKITSVYLDFIKFVSYNLGTDITLESFNTENVRLYFEYLSIEKNNVFSTLVTKKNYFATIERLLIEDNLIKPFVDDLKIVPPKSTKVFSIVTNDELSRVKRFMDESNDFDEDQIIIFEFLISNFTYNDIIELKWTDVRVIRDTVFIFINFNLIPLNKTIASAIRSKNKTKGDNLYIFQHNGEKIQDYTLRKLLSKLSKRLDISLSIKSIKNNFRERLYLYKGDVTPLQLEYVENHLNFETKNEYYEVDIFKIGEIVNSIAIK